MTSEAYTKSFLKDFDFNIATKAFVAISAELDDFIAESFLKKCGVDSNNDIDALTYATELEATFTMQWILNKTTTNSQKLLEEAFLNCNDIRSRRFLVKTFEDEIDWLMFFNGT
eukprot:UN14839